MNPDRWARIRDIFGEAINYSGPDRRDFVCRACEHDDTLQREIENLLESHERPALLDRHILPPGIAKEAASLRMFREGQLVSGRFCIERFMGEGGMGEVYAADDRELHIRVALKTLHAHLAGSPKFAQRFRQEIQLARQVSHPNVCRIFDAGRHEGTLYLTMELLEGETLAERLSNKGPMSVAESAPIIGQLCDALSAAHGAGVLHRDFKSANVMLAGSRAVVTDFGLARLVEAGTSAASTASVAVGTPVYMAPEQLEGQFGGGPADIYALGVVIYEMLTGERPWRETTPLALAAAKLREFVLPQTFAAAIGPQWESVIRKCLSTRPEHRFADAREIAAALQGTSPALRRMRVPPTAFKIAACVAILVIAGTLAFRSIVMHGVAALPSAQAVNWYHRGTDALAEGSFLKAANLLERAVSLDSRYIPAHARLAEAYAELDMSDKAKDEVIRAVTLAPDRSKLPRPDADLLNATQLLVAREFSRAEQVYRGIAGKAPAPDRGRAWLDVGRAAENANRANDAIDAYRMALELSPQREVPLLRLGRLNARQGRKAEAAAQLDEARQLFQLAANYEGVTEARLELARMYENSSLPDAESQTRSAIETAGLTANLQQQVRSRFELGRVKLLQGHADEAAAVAEEAIGLAESQHLDNLSVQGLNDLAAVLSRQLNWKQVEVQCQRALVLARRSRSRAGEARAIFYLAQARMDQDDNEAALRYLGQSLLFYRQGGDSAALQDVLALESDLLCAQGRYAEAKADAAEMQKWGETHDDQQTLILALQRDAEPRVFEGDYAGALQLYRRETDLEQRSGRHAGVVYALINQADMLWRLGRYPESTARLADARGILKDLGDGARGPRERLDLVDADSLLSQLRLREAHAKVNQALASSEGGITARVIAAQALRGLTLVRLGDIAAGRELCAESLRRAQGGGSQADIASSKLAVAEAAYLAHDSEAAILAKNARELCLRYNRGELALRALLIQWSSEKNTKAADSARGFAAAFERESAGLEKLWGAGSLQAYLLRPDIHSLIPSR